MNTIAIMPSLFLHFLQRQNIKRSTVKQVNAEVKSLPPPPPPPPSESSSSPIAAELEMNNPVPNDLDPIAIVTANHDVVFNHDVVLDHEVNHA